MEDLSEDQQVRNTLISGQDAKAQLEKIYILFNQDQFHTVKYLEDFLLEEASSEHHEKCSLILLSILMKECSNDKYRIEQTYSKLLQGYLKSDANSHLLYTLTHLLNYFPEHIYLEGDKLFGHFISQDLLKAERILKLLQVALRPLKLQLDTHDLNVMKLNTIQKNIIDVADLANLVDGLMRLSEKTMMTGKLKNGKNSKQMEMVNDQEEDKVKLLAINALLLLKNQLSKPQKKKLILLLQKNIKEIEVICNNDKDLMTDYFYFLQMNKEDFYKGKEDLIFIKLSYIANEYMKTISISQNKYTIHNVQKWEYSEKLKQYEQLFMQIEKQQDKKYLKITNMEDMYNNQDRFLLFKSTCYQITVQIFFQQKLKILKKNPNEVFELILALSKMSFSVYLDNEDIPDYDTEMSSCVQGLYDFVCDSEKKIDFLDFIYSKFTQLDKKTEIVGDRKTLIEREDKFTAIGCYIILEYMSSKIVENMKGYSIRFMSFISYHLFDDSIFTYASMFLAEMANYFTSNITAYHINFMPQLVSILQETTHINKKISIIDAISKLYDQLTFQRIKDMYPYLNKVLSFLVKEYTSKDFFKQELLFTDQIQKLIIQIINLKEIENYHKDQILEYVDIFITMILDPEQRTLLITKNHQLVLYGFLMIQMRLNNVSPQLLEQVRSISKEVAYKINKEGSTMKIEERLIYYQFLKKLTVQTMGEQQSFDEIFLLILPQILIDSKTDVTIKNYTIKENERLEDDLGDFLEEEEDEDEQGEIEEEQEHTQVNYSTPQDEKVILVHESITVLAVLSEQSPDIFMNYKKFDILEIIQQIQENIAYTEDILIQGQSVMGRILVAAQKYLMEQEKQSLTEEQLVAYQAAQLLSDNLKVEITPLLTLLIRRFVNHTDHLLYKQVEDRILLELHNTIEKLDKKTINTYFHLFYSLSEKILFENIGQANSNSIGNCISCITEIFRAVPSQIMKSLPDTWKIIQLILTQTEEPQISYEEFLEAQRFEQIEEIQVKQFVVDPFIVISCVGDLQEMLRIEPNYISVIYPIFNHILLNEDFAQYEQYLQYACEYLKKIVRYCKDKLDISDLRKYYQIIQSLVEKIDEDYFQEISPVENLRIAYAMLATIIDLDTENNNQDTRKCYELFLEIVPLRDEVHEFPYIVIIVDYLIKKKYEFTVIQINNIMQSLLRAIDNPGNFDAKDTDIHNSFQILDVLSQQNKHYQDLLRQNIASQITILPKEVLLKGFNLVQDEQNTNQN